MQSIPSIVAVLAAFLYTSFSNISANAKPSDQPNVVLVLSDDQGWTDYGFMGHEIIQTPNLDRLARESLVFPRGYVPASLCRPSLASIVTGLYPHQHGIVGNDPDGNRTRELNNQAIEEFHQHPSLVRLLVNQGYRAFQSGKWWEGSWKDGGFTAGMTHGDPDRGGRHGDAGLQIGREGMEPVKDFISSAVANEQPFFVWYAPFLPHEPHNPPKEILTKYKQKGLTTGVARYYAMCEWFDSTCGELIDHVDDAGVRDNTLVLYVCDNGWSPLDHASKHCVENLPDGWWKRFSPRSKGSPFEFGIRTPIMVSWTGRIRSESSKDLASSIDLMPTVLKACGIDLPPNLQGVNLLDEQARRNRDAVFGGAWSVHNMVLGDPQATLQYRWCVTPQWKLIERHQGLDETRYRVVHAWDDVPTRLYRIDDDESERNNLADEQPATVQRLANRLDSVIPVPK